MYKRQDRYDAACFEYGEEALTQHPAPIWDELLSRLDAYAGALFAVKTPIDHIRATIAARCGEEMCIRDRPKSVMRRKAAIKPVD